MSLEWLSSELGNLDKAVLLWSATVAIHLLHFLQFTLVHSWSLFYFLLKETIHLSWRVQNFGHCSASNFLDRPKAGLEWSLKLLQSFFVKGSSRSDQLAKCADKACWIDTFCRMSSREDTMGHIYGLGECHIRIDYTFVLTANLIQL